MKGEGVEGRLQDYLSHVNVSYCKVLSLGRLTKLAKKEKVAERNQDMSRFIASLQFMVLQFPPAKKYHRGVKVVKICPWKYLELLAIHLSAS